MSPIPVLPPVYAILDLPEGGDVRVPIRRLEELLAGGLAMAQIRAKHLGGAELLALCRRAAAACREAGALLIVNDRVDVAAMSGAGGVHLGATDLPVAAARRIAPGLLVGATVRGPGGALRAAAAGAGYVAVGPMGATRTKRVPAPVRGPRVLGATVAALRRAGSTCPVVAVGGIGPAQAEVLFRRGATTVAVCGALATGGIGALRSFGASWGRARKPVDKVRRGVLV